MAHYPLRVARYWIAFYEGDNAGVIDEPWLRDVHELLGRVQAFLVRESARS